MITRFSTKGKEQDMNGKLLVTYASKYGATREIAEKIGNVLHQAGWLTDVSPVKEVVEIEGYQAVILGSAVYIGKWQKDAAEFLQKNEQTLTQLPVWLFSSGPTGEGEPVELLEGWRLPVELQPIAERIQPRDIAVFGGYINPDKVNFIEKTAVKNIVKKPFGDFRDWNKIVAWANMVAVALSAS
jgi:menaquinone-dependent protoporphyrinogen oxidase